MKISIVTPSFDQGAFIEEAIVSVLEQGKGMFEHIIVDNCSTDETSAVLAKYPHVKIIREKDRGQSDALNKGFRAATGDIVGWLNADDRYLPECFTHVLDGFGRSLDADILYGDYRLIDKNGHFLRARGELPFDMFMLKYLHVLYIPSTTVFFRRRVFDEHNFININYHYSMDYEFFVRLALKGYKFFYTPVMLADFRWHEEAKSQKQTACQRAEMEKALFALDPYLNRYPEWTRRFIRAFLMFLARAKRAVLKLLKGAYS